MSRPRPRLVFRPLPLLSLCVVIAFAALLQLGHWQWKRYEDKKARAGAIETVTLVAFEPVRGRLQLVYGVLNGQAVWRVFAPVTQGEEIIFLDVAVLPGIDPPDWRTLKEPFAGAAAVRGVPIRPGRPSPFAAKHDPKSHAWYAIDLPAMARAVGGPRPAAYYLAVPYLAADGALAPNPFATRRDPLPPERHLGYALTWWGLAAALVGVYAAYHIRAGRLSFGRKPSQSR